MAKAETGPENPQVTNLMQDQKTGKLVEFIGVHDKEYAMICDTWSNKVLQAFNTFPKFEWEK